MRERNHGLHRSLEIDKRNPQVNRESAVALFFDKEKANDIMWKEGLLMKLHTIGVSGCAYDWIKDFNY